MKMLTIDWNNETDKTKITYHKAFMESGWIVHMEILKDVINELTNHYDDMLETENAMKQQPSYVRIMK